MDVRKLAHAIGAAPLTYIGDEEVIKPTKAYKNTAFVNSSSAKHLRVLAEMTETEARMSGAGINKTILFFGSARSKNPEEHAEATAKAQAALAAAGSDAAAKSKAEATLKRLAAVKWMSDVYPDVQELARRLTVWSLGRIGPDGRLPYAVATGGGPGLMEAANRGAASVPGAMTLGAGISLPFEVGLNKYVTPELGFEYHYFFMRKFSMCAPCRAFVATPGGYGTLDELFEVLTLLQTGKIEHPDLMPVVLFGSAFWRRIVDWQGLVDMGTISQSDVDRLFFTDSVEDAFTHLTTKLVAWETAAARAASESAAAAFTDRTRLSAPAQAFMRYSEQAAAASAAALGEGLPAGLYMAPAGVAAAGGSSASDVAHVAGGAAASATLKPARRASFRGPPPDTPGHTQDDMPPTASEIGSPPPKVVHHR